MPCTGPNCPPVPCTGPNCPPVPCTGPNCPPVPCTGTDCPPVPCTGPNCPPPPVSQFEKFYPGTPVTAVATSAFSQELIDKNKQCVGSKGVVNILPSGALQCNKYITGEVTSSETLATFTHPLQDATTYLNTIYAAYPPKFDASFQTFYSNLEILYDTSFKRVKPVEQPKFYNTAYLEVVPMNIVFTKLDRATWKGSWYIMGTGTGWFIRNNTTFYCYNSLHGLNLFGISDGAVQAAFGSALPDRNSANVPTAKIKFLSEKVQQLLAQIAIQRGYKIIQISNEWDGTKYERYCVDLVEQIYSVANSVKKNPFFIETNPSTENLWLDVFLVSNVPKVDSQYILDVVPAKTLGERYGDFAFKTGCSKQYATINIGDMLLNCEAIVKFGMPSKRLASEMKDIDFTKYPQSTELEKLQSYFTIVYGSPDIWKSKDIATLQDYWKRIEMRYKLPIMPTSVYNKYKPLSFGIAAPGLIAYQEDGRLAEAVRYVEVIRQNLKNSWYDTSQYFSGCYYYPCRGSGLFIPVGKLFIAKTKQLAAKVWQQPIASGWNPDDIDIAKMASYKGYDTLLLVRYSGFTSPEAVELVDLKDPITSQMSLIRTHPWDPILQQSVPYKMDDAYGVPSGIDITKCITTKQYEPGKGLNVCPRTF